MCIFAYGQTGSGKTHTMAGTNVAQLEGRGINYRALDDLFELNRRRSDEVLQHTCHVLAFPLSAGSLVCMWLGWCGIV